MPFPPICESTGPLEIQEPKVQFGKWPEVFVKWCRRACDYFLKTDGRAGRQASSQAGRQAAGRQAGRQAGSHAGRQAGGRACS